MKNAKRIAIVGGIAAVFIGGFAGSALARTGSGAEVIQNGYVKFDGKITWLKAGTADRGGMLVSGNLYDTSADSNSVKIDGKVSGYPYVSLWTNSKGNGSVVSGSVNVFDKSASSVSTGRVQVCRFNSWGTDQCAFANQSR